MAQCSTGWTDSQGSATLSAPYNLAAISAAYQAWACNGNGTVISNATLNAGVFYGVWTCPEFGTGDKTYHNDAGTDCTPPDEEEEEPSESPINQNGYGVLGRCYGTRGEAASALCMSGYPATIGGTLVACSAGNSAGALSLTKTTDGGNATAYTTAPAYADCNPSAEFATMAEMFMVFVPAVAVVWAIKNIALRYVLPQ